MTKTFTTRQLFSLADGRLSTKMDDVYEMLNHICDESLFTHHLPVALNYLKMKNPRWLTAVTGAIDAAKAITGDNFERLMIEFDKHPILHQIPQLKDEFDTSDFGPYMMQNSLLHTIGSAVKS